jgi:hypothetical protein
MNSHGLTDHTAGRRVSDRFLFNGSVHPAYNSFFSAYFFSRNSIFLSQQISHQCFLAGLSAQPNGANVVKASGAIE